jgi:hypothetical protein
MAKVMTFDSRIFQFTKNEFNGIDQKFSKI